MASAAGSFQVDADIDLVAGYTLDGALGAAKSVADDLMGCHCCEVGFVVVEEKKRILAAAPIK